MKNMFSKLLFYKTSISLIIFIFTSCEYENAGINSVDRPVSYSGDIIPFMKQNCALAGCHVTNSITGNFNDYSEIKLRIDNGKFQSMVFDTRLMPPSNYPPLSEIELTKLRKWISSGAKQN